MLRRCCHLQTGKAQLFEKHTQCIHEPDVRTRIGCDNQNSIVKHIRRGIGKAGAFHARHGVRPNEGKAVFLRNRLHLLANHTLDARTIHHDCALLEILCMCPDIVYRQMRIQAKQNQITILGVAILHKAMHRLHQQGAVADGFGAIPAEHRMLCFFLDCLRHGAANQPQANYANLHILTFLSFAQ